MMSSKKRVVCVVGCLLTMTALSVAAGETDYEIVRSVISAGGSSSSSGGDYEMAGTIGQALVHFMDGGDYSLDGGFWNGIAPGDCEADGYVDLIDHLQFSDCVTGPDTASAEDQCQCYDVDLSGTIDLLDFAEMQAAFTGS